MLPKATANSRGSETDSDARQLLSRGIYGYPQTAQKNITKTSFACVHEHLQVIEKLGKTFTQGSVFFKEQMKTLFEKGRYSVGKKQSLEWIRVRTCSPRGLVFVPPLIGGNLSQQVSSFRWLIRREYDLVSFNYSGHGSSLKELHLEKTSVLCLYARKDTVLEIYDHGARANYQNDILRVCPQTLFHPWDGDHFLSLPMAKGQAVRSILSFL